MYSGKLIKGQCIYIIHNKEFNITKIGISDNPEYRMNTLKTACGCVLELKYKTFHILDALKHESDCHEYFKDKRKLGEWFNIEPNKAIEYIKSIQHKFTPSPIIADYLINKLTITAIAEQNGVSRQAIIKHLKESGVYQKNNGEIYKSKPQIEKEPDKGVKIGEAVLDMTKYKNIGKNQYKHRYNKSDEVFNIKYIDGFMRFFEYTE